MTDMFMLLVAGSSILVALALLFAVRPQGDRGRERRTLSAGGAYFADRI